MNFGQPARRDVVVRTRLRDDSAEDLEFDFHETFALELVDSLPEVCARHGEAAVERVDKAFEFRPRNRRWFSKGFRWVQRTAWYEMGFVLDMLFRTATFRRTKDFTPPSTVLEGSWPVCSKCLRGRRIWQYLGHAIVLAGIGLIIAILIAIQISTSKYLPPPLGLALFPGWIPCGLMVAVLAYRHSGVLVLFRPITEHTAVTINAHPKFADAGESRGTPTEIREW